MKHAKNLTLTFKMAGKHSFCITANLPCLSIVKSACCHADKCQYPLVTLIQYKQSFIQNVTQTATVNITPGFLCWHNIMEASLNLRL